MKNLINRFVLAFVVSSMAFVACSVDEKKTSDQTGADVINSQQIDSTGSSMQLNPAEEVVNDAKSTEVTPDMARNELNGGAVRRVTMHIYSPLYNMTNKTISFDTQGTQLYKHGVAKRDEKGRVKSTIVKEKDYLEETFAYVESSRLAYGEEVEGFVDPIEGVVLEAGDYRHYYYADNTNNPEGMFSICCQDICPAYTEYNYLEFDKLGNWIKREAICYTFDYTSAFVGQYENLIQNLDDVYPDYKKNKVEPQLISLIKKSCKRPEKMTETRKIEYFE